MDNGVTVVEPEVEEWRRPVLNVPLRQAFPELGEVKEYANKRCIITEDRSKVFAVLPERAKIIEHGKIVDVMADVLSKEYGTKEFKISSYGGGARVKAVFDLPRIAPVEVSKGDIITLRFELYNSYDRSWGFNIKLGALRLACTNGMVTNSFIGGISAKSLGYFDKISEIQHRLSALAQRASMLKEVWTLWKEISITYDQATEMFGKKFPKKFTENVLSQEFPMTKWELYNVSTNQATHMDTSSLRRIAFDHSIASIFFKDAKKELKEASV